jgi:hypothetical protein
MIKSIVLVALAAIFSSSLVLVQAENGGAAAAAAADAVDPFLSNLRKAVSAGIPAEQRKLQTTTCYKDLGNGQASQASCDSVGSCNPTACCASSDTCVGLGQFWCEVANGFAVEYVNDFLCPYKWSCCY